MIRKKGEGSVRKINDSAWECITTSQYLNPKTGKPKRFKRVAPSEKEAIEKAKMAKDAWEKEFIKGKDVKVNRKKTFGEYMDEFIETEVKPGLTASGYHSYISTMKNNFYPFPISKLQLHMLNVVEFESYYNTILALKSKKTCNLPRQLCSRCCKWLVNKSLLKENYAAQAKTKKEVADEYDHKREEELKNKKEVFSYDDIQKFYHAYKNNIGQYAVVALFLLETGMRAGEFAALRNSNIDIARRRIDIVETNSLRFKENDKNNGVEYYTKVPKNKESRFVMMSDLCVECVLYMQEQTKLRCESNPNDLLYPVFSSGRIRQTSAMEVGFKSLCDKIGVDRDVRLTKTGQQKGLCLHSLRHTADSIANSAKGANVVNTALAMGHKAIATENIYTHPTEEALRTITTPSQAVLDGYKKNENNKKGSLDDEKLLQMYLQLKEKFEPKTN